MNKSIYTLRKAAGGYSHFARVTVGDSGLEQETSIDYCDQLPEWGLAADDGIRYALRTLQSKKSVSALLIEGTIADTRADTVFAAAALATFAYFGNERFEETYVDGKWEVATN